MSSMQGRFLSPDAPLMDQQAENPQTWNLYAYARNNPLKHTDSTGNVVETLWDAVNVAMDVASLAKNVATGNYGAAAVDAGGLLVDAAATLLPGVPGGAGTAIKAARAADAVVDVAQSARKAERLAENVKAGKLFEQQLAAKVRGAVEQLTVKTQSGVRTRLDVVGKDAAGNFIVAEGKASNAARLTKNQKKAFPEIEQSGATVVGRGKGAFPGGTKIPPTKVQVVRPNELDRFNAQ